MLYMILEKYKEGSVEEIYRRAREKGRMLPPGLNYISSWVDMDFKRCFQIMETKDQRLFQVWMQQWNDLIDFAVIPVRTSDEAVRIMQAMQ